MNAIGIDADDASEQAATLLRGVAHASARLAAFRRALQDVPEITRVDAEFDCLGTDAFPTTPKGVLSWWVEATYRDGSSRCFTLDFYRDGPKWIIETGITTPGRDGPEPIAVLPERSARLIEDCSRELLTAIDELWRAAAIDEATAGRSLEPPT